MYAALLGQRLVLARVEAKKARQSQRLNRAVYRCPHCRHRVLLILTQRQEPFFKHLAATRGRGEQAEHHLGKTLLQSALAAAGFSAKLEVPLAAGQIRADVLASANLAFEVQCAPLGQKEFAHRHHLYQQSGVQDIWVVGQAHFLKQKLKKTQAIYLRHNQSWQWYFLELVVDQQLLRLKYNLRQAPWSQRLFYQEAVFELDEQGMAALWKFRPLLRQPKLALGQEMRYLQKQIVQKTQLGLRVAAWLYQQHLSPAALLPAFAASWQPPGAGYPPPVTAVECDDS